MRDLKLKKCRICNNEYKPRGSAQLYCDVCFAEHKKASARERNRKSRIKQGRVVGVGSGNAQGRGPTHHTYKNGIRGFRNRKLESMETYNCEDCGLDLTEIIATNKYKWCVHHIDEDRDNNELQNLKLLCKRCHQITHNCIDNLSS